MTSLGLTRNGKTKMRASILDASRRLCVEHGEEALTIRNIAASVGVSPTIIYQHYHGKAEILHDLQRLGYAQLDARLAEIDEPDPQRRLAAMCRGYVGFALDHPWLYELLMLRWDDPEGDVPEPQPAFVHRLSRCVHDGVAVGALRREIVPEDAALQLWAAMHGLTTALLGAGARRSMLAVAPTDREAVLEGYVALLARGLAA
jgi:AcrR family transcriptional regulator